MSSASRLAALLVLLSIVGCGSPPVSDTWRDPVFTSPLRFHRTLVIAMISDVLVRRPAETVMVNEIGEGRSIQSYKLLSHSDLYDVNHLVQKLTPNGIDGILIMRLVSTKNDVSWVPGSGVYPFDPFWSFYDRAWPAAHEPDYLKNETTVRLQTNLYSVEGGKLLWTGISDSFLAADAQSRIEPVVRQIAYQMESEGLLK